MIVYSTELPSCFMSWFDFYGFAKPHFETGVEDVYVQTSTDEVIVNPASRNHARKYSIQYIKNQVLEELYELRALQTFSFEELHYLRSSLQISERFETNSNKATQYGLQEKIGQLLITIRKRKC